MTKLLTDIQETQLRKAFASVMKSDVPHVSLSDSFTDGIGHGTEIVWHKVRAYMIYEPHTRYELTIGIRTDRRRKLIIL